MKKHLIVSGVVFVLLMVGLSGCNEISNPLKSDKDRFVGNWEKESGVERKLVLFSDGDCSYSGFSGIWEIKDGKLVIDVEGQYGSVKIVYEYYFSNNDNNLNLKDVSSSGSNEYVVWYKQ